MPDLANQFSIRPVTIQGSQMVGSPDQCRVHLLEGAAEVLAQFAGPQFGDIDLNSIVNRHDDPDFLLGGSMTATLAFLSRRVKDLSSARVSFTCDFVESEGFVNKLDSQSYVPVTLRRGKDEKKMIFNAYGTEPFRY